MVTPAKSSTKSTTISWKESISGIGRVELAGSFSSWLPLTMTRSFCGNWSASVDIPRGRHEYKVIVDGDWRIDESVPSVGNDMGTENNVIHVPHPGDLDDVLCQEDLVDVTHHEEVDEKETTAAETCSSHASRVDPRVEANSESRNHLLKVESKEENPLLMSPLTRGKLKKFTAENGSTAGNAGSQASGSAGKGGFKSSENAGSKASGSAGKSGFKLSVKAGLKSSAGATNATSKPSGSSRNPSFKPTGSAGSRPLGSAGNAASKPTGSAGSRPLGSAGSACSKPSENSRNPGFKSTGSAGSRLLGRAGNPGSKPLGSTGNAAPKPLGSTGNAAPKPLGSTGNAAHKPSEPKVKPRSALLDHKRVQAARAQLPKNSVLYKNPPMVNMPLVNNERSELGQGPLMSGVQPQPSTAHLATNDKKSRPAPANKSGISEKHQPVKRSLSNAENQIPSGPPVFCRGRRGKF